MEARDTTNTVQAKGCISYNTSKHSFSDSHLEVIPLKCAFSDGSGSMLAEVVVPGSEGDLTNPSPSGFDGSGSHY